MLNRISRAPWLLAFGCAFCLAQNDSSLGFDVASVKPAPQQRLGAFSGGPGSSDPGRITYESTTLENLIRGAYNLQPYQISGPARLTTEYYSVTATLPAATTMDQLRQMTANLLADRFGMVTHRVVKDFAGYEITVAKGGPKLTPSPPGDGGLPVFRGTADGRGGQSGDSRLVRYQFTQTSMAILTNRLSIMLGMKAPVVDHTGIGGRFDFTLNVETLPIDRGGRLGNASADFGDNSSNISDAMQNQLGLKLNKIKIPMDVLVIDHAERVPAPNQALFVLGAPASSVLLRQPADDEIRVVRGTCCPDRMMKRQPAADEHR
jgi:uncharacterized protein (TIGR03435 family)